MFDYVTNGLAFWTTEDLKKSYTDTYRKKGEDPDEVIKEFLGESTTPEQFWLQIESNIRSEKIRMVYVADVISPEMKRIVEFLSRQMRTASIVGCDDLLDV